MAKTPTKVLLVLDCTIFLERVWSGGGKSWMWKKKKKEKDSIKNVKSLLVLQITTCIFAARILQCAQGLDFGDGGWRLREKGEQERERLTPAGPAGSPDLLSPP